MSYQRTVNESDLTAGPACVHLRSKAMYVTGDLNPSHLDEAGSHYCWCNLTQHIVGPDDAPVDRCNCVGSRECYHAR
ncbi:MAG: hypothetical protein VB835_10205 [Pirellulales bacterium]